MILCAFWMHCYIIHTKGGLTPKWIHFSVSFFNPNDSTFLIIYCLLINYNYFRLASLIMRGVKHNILLIQNHHSVCAYRLFYIYFSNMTLKSSTVFLVFYYMGQIRSFGAGALNFFDSSSTHHKLQESL